MIRNFELYTSEMTDEENNYILPRLLNLLILAIGKEKAITNKQILTDINITNPIEYTLEDDPTGTYKTIKTRSARIRHMIHILRVSDTIPYLLASAKGYYISIDKDEIIDYISSIEDRLRSIYSIRKALKNQLTDFSANRISIQQKLNF